MADENNPGQFGNRADTEEQARKGGRASHSGSSAGDSENKMSREEAGRKGGESRGRSDSEMDAE